MIKHVVRISSAVILILIGIVGLVLPLVPGMVLIFLGVALILDRNPKILFKELLAKAKAKYGKK